MQCFVECVRDNLTPISTNQIGCQISVKGPLVLTKTSRSSWECFSSNSYNLQFPKMETDEFTQ